MHSLQHTSLMLVPCGAVSVTVNNGLEGEGEGEGERERERERERRSISDRVLWAVDVCIGCNPEFCAR